MIVVGIPAVLLVAAFLLLPALARPSNCGGNSAALSACKSVVTCFRLIGLERGDEPVAITTLSASERAYFRQIAGLNWLRSSKVLVSTSAVTIADQQSTAIVAVCDKAFDNVPRRVFGKAPLTHAVAYTDGTVGLLPLQDFQRLDLSQFIDVRSIPEKKVEPGAAPNDGPAAPTENSDDSGGGRHR